MAMDKNKSFIIYAVDDSMIDVGINIGDRLLIEMSKEYVSGDIVLAETDDGEIIRRFIVDGGKIYLQPENPAYKKKIIIPGEVKFKGKVILNLSKVK